MERTLASATCSLKTESIQIRQRGQHCAWNQTLSRNLLRDIVELQSLGFIKRTLSDRVEKHLPRNFLQKIQRGCSIARSHIDPGKGTGIPLNLDAARAFLQEEDAFYPSLVWHVL